MEVREVRSNPRSEEVIEIGKRIRDIRTNKKMSQADLADKANILNTTSGSIRIRWRFVPIGSW